MEAEKRGEGLYKGQVFIGRERKRGEEAARCWATAIGKQRNER